MLAADKKIIADELLIAGLFREALFQSHQVRLRSDHKEFYFLVSDIQETSSRSKTTVRTVVLSVKNAAQGSGYTALSGEIELSLLFPNFVATFTMNAEKSKQEGLTLSFQTPKRLTVHNRREKNRTEASMELPNVNVYLSTRQVSCQGDFKLTNISAEGFGGLLTIESSAPVTLGSKILGRLSTSLGSIKINGFLTNASLLDKLGDTNRYQIGVARDQPWDLQDALITATQSNNPKRRRHQRRSANFLIALKSILNPTYSIKLQVEDISVAGFSAKIINKSDKILLFVSDTYKLTEPSLTVCLTSCQRDIVRFEICGGSETQRMRWLENVGDFFDENISTGFANAGELINLFCESGATSKEYLRNYKSRSNSLKSILSSNQNLDGLIFRMINQSSTSGLKGHISSTRFGDNAWMIGDIAGRVEQERKIDRDFIQSFFDQFGGFCRTVAPCPAVLIGWSQNHPYWKKFKAAVTEPSCAATEAAVLLERLYVRFSKSKQVRQEDTTAITFSEVEASNWAEIANLRCAINPSNEIRFIDALDLSVSSFGSPRLESLIEISGSHFGRRYTKIHFAESIFLLVSHQFPDFFSVNSTTHCPWLFQVGGSGLKKENYELLIAAIHSYIISIGHTAPGILLPATDASSAPDGARKMDWILIHPGKLELFKKDGGIKY